MRNESEKRERQKWIEMRLKALRVVLFAKQETRVGAKKKRYKAAVEFGHTRKKDPAHESFILHQSMLCLAYSRVLARRAPTSRRLASISAIDSMICSPAGFAAERYCAWPWPSM